MNYPPVAVAPPVNRLLDVAHHEVVIAARECFCYQRPEVVPLDARCILELINDVMIIGRSNLLIDKRSVIIGNKLADQLTRVGKEEKVLFMGLFPYPLADCTKNTDDVYCPDLRQGGNIETVSPVKQV